MRQEIHKDIVIIGGGIGGCTAALSAAKMGKHVIMTEETPWIGGQLTSQGVPPDEHPWIEEFGCSQTYREFRNLVRDYYRKHYPLTTEARKIERLNPGNAWVSRIAHEPRVALRILYDMLGPYLSNGRIEILLNHQAIQATTEKDTIQNVTVKEKHTGQEVILHGHYFLDATECGDLLPLAGAEYTTGAESKEETGELHALETKIPQDMQSITHVFAVDYCEGEDHTIEKPEQYDFWKEYQAPFLKHKQLSWGAPDAHTGDTISFPMFSNEDKLGLWDYRRIINTTLFEEDFFKGDVSLINWPQNDYWLGSIIDVNEEEKEKHKEAARQLSLSLLYWLQTDAPRDDGGYGYPEIRLRPDVMGTEDGLAMHPYIRESRRIQAHNTMVEEQINAETRGEKGIEAFEYSVGIGCYRIDLHPTTITNRLFYAKSYPFEIPMGSLIPVRITNLLPSCKNIGCTHITNGCVRVHPVEWNIGESSGTLAAFAIDQEESPAEIYQSTQAINRYQQQLIDLGVQLHWPEIKEI